jgi:hypothetical protein
MEDFNFTYKTDKEFQKARKRGYIESYNIVRINIKDDKSSFDFPINSEEEFLLLKDYLNAKQLNYNVYSDVHSYDIQDYI